MTLFILKGILIGFSIAAPVGPIGVLCIRRTLTSGRLACLLSGLGAAASAAPQVGQNCKSLATWLPQL